MDYARQLRQWREDADLSQEQVGRYLGLDRSAISYYEQGRVQPNAQAMLRLCLLYRVTERDMLWCIAGLAEQRKTDIEKKKRTP